MFLARQTFFVCLTLYLASLSRVSQRVDWLRWLVAGGSAALAFLTTPRALFLLPVVVPVALSHRFSSQAKRDRRRALWQPLLAFVCFALPVAAWIGSLGGVGAYLAIQNSGVVRDHIAPSFLRAPYELFRLLLPEVDPDLFWLDYSVALFAPEPAP